MKSTIEFTHGEHTCAYEPGKFCRFFSTIVLGQAPFCRLYGLMLDEKDGWVQRSEECIEEFGSDA